MQLLTFTLTGMDYGISLENVESIESKMNVVVVPTSPANIRGIIRTKKLHCIRYHTTRFS